MRFFLVAAIWSADAGAVDDCNAYITVLDTFDAYALENPAIVRYNSQIYLFHTRKSGTIGQIMWTAWSGCTAGPCNNPAAWSVLDGAGGANGELTNLMYVSRLTTRVSTTDGKLHIFYSYDAGTGRKLRHGKFDGTAWTFQTIDGNGGTSGQTINSVGGDGIGAADFSNGVATRLFISYYDITLRDLRIGTTGDGINWVFSTHDGHTSSTQGQLDGDIGRTSTLVSAGGSLHVLYSDDTRQDLRHGWRGSVTSWTYRTRDGNGAFTHGPVNNAVSAVYHGGVLHVFYSDYSLFNVVHAWTSVPNSTSAWSYAVRVPPGLGGVRALGGAAACSDGSWIRLHYTSLTDPGDPFAGNDLMTLISSGSGPWYSGPSDGHIDDYIYDDVFGRINSGVGSDAAISCGANFQQVTTLYTWDWSNALRLRTSGGCD